MSQRSVFIVCILNNIALTEFEKNKIPFPQVVLRKELKKRPKNWLLQKRCTLAN